MKISTRAKYGLRLCFLIAVSGEQSVPLSTLVKQSSLSEKYLEQILAMLKKGEIVGAKRGTSGGYYLIKKPTDITINAILSALNDNFEFSDCVVGQCKDDYCPNKKIFTRIYDGINNILDNTSLQDMITDYKCIATTV